MSLLAIIPARGGSKRLPRKNFLEIEGKSLLQRAIECAIDSGLFERDNICVTSDDPGGLGMARHHSVRRVGRVAALCADDVETQAVVFDVLSHYGYQPDVFCVLNPTTPTRTPEELRRCYECFKDIDQPYLLSGKPPKHDGAYLFGKTASFLKDMAFKRNSWFESSQRHIDINHLWDLNRAREVIRERESVRDSGSGLEPRE